MVMHLRVGTRVVEAVEFGSRSELTSRTLLVSAQEIRDLVLEDNHFQDVDIHLVRPGDSTRIIHPMDLVEPRWKVSGPGGVFPGFVSPTTTVGEGQTNRLAGVAIIEAGDPVPGEPTQFREQIIDMAGPGAAFSPFSQTQNILLEFKPNLAFFPDKSVGSNGTLEGGTAAAEYNRAMVKAGMKVAARLGQLANDVELDEVETYTLPPVDPSLPRVVCMYHVLVPYLYGSVAKLRAATVIHPNECFDGALTGWRQNFRSTYWNQNNETLRELIRHHGRDINLVGLVLFGDRSTRRDEKDRTAGSATRVAQVLGADAALFMGINGSNHALDLMWTLQKCERAGIKSVLIQQEVGYGPDDPGFIFSVPEADAIVCTGSRDQWVTLPPVNKVVGGDHLVNPDMDASKEIRVPLRYLHSSCGVQGYNFMTTRLH